MAALLTGCASPGPGLQAPKLSATRSYTAGGDARPAGDQRIALGKTIEAHWWRLFASRPLDGVIRQALKDNLDVAAAKEVLAQAQEAVIVARSGALPQVSLGGAAGRQKYGVALFGPSNFKIPPFTYYEAGPGASWSPDLFGGTRHAVEREQALARYRQHELNAAYLSLTGSVAAQCLAIAGLNAELAALNRVVEEDRLNLAKVRGALAAGGRSRADVLHAKSQLDSDETLFAPIEQKLSVARHALAVLVGKAPADWKAPQFDLAQFKLPRALPVSLPSELVHRRPDILAAEDGVHAAAAAVGIATANLYPRITLNANFLQEALAPHGLLEAASRAWSLAGNITQPIFDAGRLSAEKRAAQHAYQAALAQYRKTIVQAFGEVADTLQALRHDADELAAQKTALDTAQASLRLARTGYALGSAGILDVLDAERAYSRGRLAYVRTQAQRYQDTVRLFVALGGSPIAADR